MTRTPQAPPQSPWAGTGKLPPPPMSDLHGPRTNRQAGGAEALSRVFAAALAAPVRLKPSDRLTFARHAVDEFIATLDAEVLK